VAQLGASLHEDTWHPLTDAQRAAARQQLYRLIASPLFSHSRRYPAFLRYVVEQTLSGHGDELKERTIGLEVFQRDIHYDTSADPIVRVTAAEIRKRLAQYYYEAGHEQEIRIQLSSGSYVPQFHLPEGLQVVQDGTPRGLQSKHTVQVPPQDSHENGAAAAAIAETEPSGDKNPGWPAPSPSLPARAWHRVNRWVALGAAIALVAAISLTIREKQVPRTPHFQQFWDQIAKSDGPVQICFGAPPTENATASGLPITLTAFQTATRITNLLDQRNKSYLSIVHLLGPQATDLSELRDGPIVFFGPWEPVEPIMENWRYRFVHDEGTSTIWIVDSNSPSKKLWRMEQGIPIGELSESYAIAARVMDPKLHRPIILAAGVDRLGIRAGVIALTTPAYMENLLKNAPADWQGMNMEAVIETRIVNGKLGTPRVVAEQFWK
jgi:hypothetical protein